MEAVAKPCPACPFTRTSKPGHLGNSPAPAFVVQAAGPFTLPCHAHCDFDDPDWRAKAPQTPQCAGAASFRTHIFGEGGIASDGKMRKLPDAIPMRAADPNVFQRPSEFVAHHMQMHPTHFRLYDNPIAMTILVREEMINTMAGKKPGEGL